MRTLLARCLRTSLDTCPERGRLWRCGQTWGVACYALLFFLAMPAAGQDQAKDNLASGAAGGEPEIEFIDVLVTRTPLPGSNVQLGYRFERVRERLAEGDATTHTNELFLSGSLAVADWLQVAASLPYDFISTRSPNQATAATSGVADLTTEVQVTFLQSQTLQLVLAGGLGVGIPTGSASNGTGGQWTLTPFLSAGQILGPVQLLADVGYQAELRTMPDRQQRLLYDVAVGYPVLDGKLFPFLELNGSYTFTGPGDLRHRGQVVLTPGVRFTPGGWLPIPAERAQAKAVESVPAGKPWWEQLSIAVGLQLPVTASRDFEWALTSALKLDF